MGSRAGHVVLQDARGSVSDPLPRSNDDLITQKLEILWPSVSARLQTMLKRRGVSSHDADEAIQETAARVVVTALAFDTEDELFKWAAVVSWRIAIDARRRRAQLSGTEVPEVADHIDVAQTAEHRIVLSAVTSRLKDLSERERAVLLSAFDDEAAASRLESVRLAVVRHRARNRLRGLLNGLLTPVIAFVVRRRGRSGQLEAFVSTAAPALACFALTLGTFGALTVTERPLPSVDAVATAADDVGMPTLAESSATSRHDAVPPQHWLPVAKPEPREISTGIRLDEPGGHSTEFGTRPTEDSDHLACATLPSLNGPVTTCADPPPLPVP